MREYPTNVAIYWDFENLQASLVEKKGGFGAYGRTKYQHQEELIDIESVMEYAATFGVVSINRAYCNWQWYGKYREALLHNGLELIQLFHPGASGKNGGDIKLCLDCTEDLLRFPQIDVVVIVGGDSDYLPLVQKIKAQGKMLVGIGAQANTNRHWAHSCHEFKFYEAILLDDEPAQRPTNQPTAPVVVPVVAAAAGRPGADSDNVVQARPEELLRRAIVRLASKSGEPWVLKGSIRPMMKRLDSTFQEEQHGVKTFATFMKKFEGLLEVRAGKYDQEVRLRELGKPATERLVEKPLERLPERVVDRVAEAGQAAMPERLPKPRRTRNRGRGHNPLPAPETGNALPEELLPVPANTKPVVVVKREEVMPTRPELVAAIESEQAVVVVDPKPGRKPRARSKPRKE